MEGLVILLVLGFVIVVFVLPIAAFVRSGRADREAQQAAARLALVQRDLAGLRESLERLEAALRSAREGPGPVASPATPGRTPVVRPAAQRPPPDVTVSESRQPSPEPAPAAPSPAPAPAPVPAPGPPVMAAPVWAASAVEAPALPRPAAAASGPPPIPSRPPGPPPVAPGPLFDLEKIKGSLNWEQFMGAKLFAWIGGLALFLGVAYFVKYSFEHNLIPPEVRVALGFLVGIGLVTGGVILRRRDYAITAHTLCATGILILYAVTFACRAVYHFAFFGAVPTFFLMSLVTVAAFLLAVRLEAEVVAVLGMLGGFLTPVLLSTGEDAPVALFGYIALLDAGLLAVALHRRWFYLATLAAAGTVLMEIGWAAKFFEAEQYYLGNKVLIPMGVLCVFVGLWLGAAHFSRRRDPDDGYASFSGAGLAAVAFGFAFYFLHFESLSARPWLLFGFGFAVDGLVLLLSRLDRRLAGGPALAGGVMFLLLAIWMGTRATNELLPAGLVFILVFASVHSLVPLALRRDEGDGPSRRGALLFPAVALLVLLVPIFRLDELTVWIWPVILMVDLLAVVLAAAAAVTLPVLAVLGLTLAAMLGVLLKIPSELTGLPTLLLVVGCGAVFFVVAGAWLSRRFRAATGPGRAGPGGLGGVAEGDLAAQVPSFAVVMSFALLVMMVGRLNLANPGPVFGLALLLVALLMALSWRFGFEWLPALGLGCVAALEHAWHFRLFTPAMAIPALAWYLVFYAVFALVPFLVRGWIRMRGPWFAAALAGPAQFFLVHNLVKAAWPNEVMGLLPAAFAVPAFLGLAAMLRRAPADSPVRMLQLALFGGGALFFVTLVFPIQFERQWLTIAWALEGAALCWLYHRVPHPGLRLAGVGLLATAFVRLALNPAVLTYHARSAVPILNWYLYTYGIAVVSLFGAARLLAPPRDRVLNVRAPVLLVTLGTVLAFLLVNIEIADFFAPPGAEALTFKFSGDFSRDMTYSIAWALFALALLVPGLVKGIAPARYAALALLGVTLLKLFFHDLASLAQLYRVGALVGVAVIAMVASFLYQRFTAMSASPHEDTHPPQAPS